MIGVSEVFFTLMIIIILFKPEDYKSIIKKILSIHIEIKKYIANFKTQICDVNIKEIKKDLEDLHNEFIQINGKNYIYGEDKKLHEVYDLKSLNDELK